MHAPPNLRWFDGNTSANGNGAFTAAGTEVEVEIQMQPMEQQSSQDADAGRDQALGSHAVLPTTYGVAVASPVTEKPADGPSLRSNEADSSSRAKPSEDQQQQQPEQQTSDISQNQQFGEPGSQPLVPASMCSGFSFWNHAPVDVWAHPTMQRYRQNPKATLGEQPPVIPARSVAADPEAQRPLDSTPGMQQETTSSKPQSLADRPSPAYPSDPAYRAQQHDQHANPLQNRSGFQGGAQHASQSQSSGDRHRGLQQHRQSEGHGRGGSNADPEGQPAGPSRADDAQAEPAGMSTSADSADRREAQQAAADVMGEDEDGGGQRGDPTPLYPAGE